MSYKQLTRDQRYHIYGLWRAGYTQTLIAKEIGVNKSTICREFKRNVFWWNSRIPQYKPDYAQTYCEDRHKYKRKATKFTKEIRDFIVKKLQQDWSPDQISGYAKRHKLFLISHERIYQFILDDKNKGGRLHLHLRYQHKKYRKRYGSPARNSPIKNRIFIDERPKVVDDKSRIGDWEIDTMIGKNRKQAIITIVERFSKKTICQKVSCRKAELTKQETINMLKPLSDFVLTITGDNVLTLESSFFRKNNSQLPKKGIFKKVNAFFSQ